MKYTTAAQSTAHNNAAFQIKEDRIRFGITKETADTLPNPAELLLGSLSACMLKNVERFSMLMKFNYSHASITIEANRLDRPPKINQIDYELKIYSEDAHINMDLLKKNIENFGTIYNTLKETCTIVGTLILLKE